VRPAEPLAFPVRLEDGHRTALGRSSTRACPGKSLIDAHSARFDRDDLVDVLQAQSKRLLATRRTAVPCGRTGPVMQLHARPPAASVTIASGQWSARRPRDLRPHRLHVGRHPEIRPPPPPARRSRDSGPGLGWCCLRISIATGLAGESRPGRRRGARRVSRWRPCTASRAVRVRVGVACRSNGPRAHAPHRPSPAGVVTGITITARQASRCAASATPAHDCGRVRAITPRGAGRRSSLTSGMVAQLKAENTGQVHRASAARLPRRSESRAPDPAAASIAT